MVWPLEAGSTRNWLGRPESFKYLFNCPTKAGNAAWLVVVAGRTGGFGATPDDCADAAPVCLDNEIVLSTRGGGLLPPGGKELPLVACTVMGFGATGPGTA